MASDKKKEKKTNASPFGALISAITRTVFTLLALVVILSVSAFLFARTEGFRSLLSDQIEKAIGLRLEADSSRIAWNGAIVFQGVRSADHEGPGLSASPSRSMCPRKPASAARALSPRWGVMADSVLVDSV